MSAAKHAPGPWQWDGAVWDYDPESEAPWLVDAADKRVLWGGIKCDSEANARLIAAAPELLAVAQEALRIDKARLILADGIDDNGHPFTEAQRNDAKAFLANRSAAWLHEAVAAIAKATQGAPHD